MFKASLPRIRLNKRTRAYIFITPVIVVGLLLIVYPLLYSLRVSFFDYNLQIGTKTFVGIDNYVSALKDPKFRNALWNTFYIAIPALALQFTLGFALALMVNSVPRGRGVITSLISCPMMIPSAAAALSFGMLYTQKYGAINFILSTLLRRSVDIAWLGSVHLVKFSIVIVDTWQMTSFVMLFLLAGLSIIPEELYDAAKVDGASTFQSFRYVTLPIMRTYIIAILSIRLIDLLKIFGIPYLLTGGGPGLASETVSMRIIETGLSFLRVGAGAAQSYILFFIEALIVGFFIISTRREGRVT
jgi:multiple sugar transport system permease protein